MKCVIKKTYGYFRRNIDAEQNAWAYKENAKIFKSVAEARKIIKKYKLKNVTIEKADE